MKVTSSRFECSAFRPSDEPRTEGPDVVFLGRSNVGKSSLINCLLGARELARTSSTPGRTQSVNFYRVNEAFHFVDLPGYGFAKVPVRILRTWRPMIEGFLDRRRERILLGILVVDARLGATELDRTMQEWLATNRIPFLVVATKSDKLSGSERIAVVRMLKSWLQAVGACRGSVLASAKTRVGIREIWRHLDGAFAGERSRIKGVGWISAN